MNKIITELSDNDMRAVGNGKSVATLAEEMLESLRAAVPYGVTFVECIPQEMRPVVEARLKKNFELWANSWIAPKLLAIVDKSKR